MKQYRRLELGSWAPKSPASGGSCSFRAVAYGVCFVVCRVKPAASAASVAHIAAHARVRLSRPAPTDHSRTGISSNANRKVTELIDCSALLSSAARLEHTSVKPTAASTMAIVAGQK